MNGDRPLENITVLDATTALAGPFATLLLAGLGARVLKLENPAAGDTSRTNAPYLGRTGVKLARESSDDISISHLNRSRNKLGITLDLKRPEAQPVFADLLRISDVVVENFSRGVMDRLGCGYAYAKEVNPRIVYCSINGFGADADSGAKAMDTIIQALSGIMYTSGGPDDPPIRVGIPFADALAPLFAVIGILSALERRHRTNEGDHVDISMLDALTSVVALEPFDVLERLGIPMRTGRTVPRLAPFGAFRCADGYVAICAPTDGFARAVLVAIGSPELADDDRFRTRDARVRHAGELERMIEDWSRALPVADVIAILEEAGAPAAEVREPGRAIRDPRVVRRGATTRIAHPQFGEVGDIYGAGVPIKFSSATIGFDRPAPALGEHNDEVYGGLLGYDAERVALLRDGRVI